MKKNTNKTYIPGRKGAIARLVIMAICVVIGLLSSTLTLPHYIAELGLGRAICEALAGCATLFLMGAFFWGFGMWIGTVGRKTARCVRWVWNNWETFFVIGLVIKCLLWIFFHYAPTAAFVLLFSPIFRLLLYMATEGVGFFAAAGLLIVSCALVVGMATWDIRKLTGKPFGLPAKDDVAVLLSCIFRKDKTQNPPSPERKSAAMAQIKESYTNEDL